MIGPACEGPLIWFAVGDPEDSAILECAACDYLVITGGWNDAAHADTPLLREGLASR